MDINRQLALRALADGQKRCLVHMRLRRKEQAIAPADERCRVVLPGFPC